VARHVLVQVRQHRGFAEHHERKKMFHGKEWACPAISVLFVVALPLQAATTNQVGLSYEGRSISIEASEESNGFTERFFKEVMSDETIVFDRFTGPSSRLAWERRQNMLGYGNLNRFNLEGAGMFATIASDSLRIAALEALPFELWEDYWAGRLASFIAGTIGNQIGRASCRERV